MTLPLSNRVLLTDDAEDRIQALGMQRELEAIVRYTQETVPGLYAIEVNPFYDDPFEPHLLIYAYRDCPDSDDDDSIVDLWHEGLTHIVPPEVAEWFLLTIDYRIDLPWIEAPPDGVM